MMPQCVIPAAPGLRPAKYSIAFMQNFPFDVTKKGSSTMKTRSTLMAYLIAAAGILVGAAPATAQQITGVPGSPSSTITIDGKQLPPPPPKFGGVIK
ncbi:MAG TPA: hypothetical protein VF104_06625, partial [Burkholderiales bacterium]